jgi:branched-subunit amino acid ABC-type transport system permease component
MAKKKQNKKHKFKYADPVGPTAGSVGAVPNRPGELKAPSARVVSTNQRDFSYVAVDMRRILILAASLVAVELVLYYLLGHTGWGDALNSLIRT